MPDEPLEQRSILVRKGRFPRQKSPFPGQREKCLWVRCITSLQSVQNVTNPQEPANYHFRWLTPNYSVRRTLDALHEKPLLFWVA